MLLHALPLFHVHGLLVASHAALFAGAKMLMLPRFDVAQVLARLPHSTVMMGVPTFYTRLLAEPSFGTQHCHFDAPVYRRVGAIAAETHQQFERTGHRYSDATECRDRDAERESPRLRVRWRTHRGHGRRTITGCRSTVANDDGSLCAVGGDRRGAGAGPNVFAGYWRMPDKTREEFTPDGWFRTGDVGHFGGAVRIVT